MCGRYTHLYTWKQLHRLMTLTSPAMELPLNPNVSPTQAAPVVRGEGGGRVLSMLRWGFVPSWSAEGPGRAPLINARAEGLEAKPTFRDSLRRRRCVVPISGFYEWERVGSRKEARYMTGSDGEVLLLAGLWDRWTPPGGGALESFAIVTTAPNEMMARIHDRMPAVLDLAGADRWLDPLAVEPAELRPLLVPCPSERLRAVAAGPPESPGRRAAPRQFGLFDGGERGE